MRSVIIISKSVIRILVALVIIITLVWVIVARPISPVTFKTKSELKVNSDRLKKHVDMISEQLSPRSHAHTENLNKIAAYISGEFKSSNAIIHQQNFVVNDKEYKNVIAEYGPASAQVIIIGAHYDAEGNNPGADDNASGIAGLLELGQLLSKTRVGSRVMLVAYSLEEPPYFGTDSMGSAIHAKTLREKGVSVKLMICLEMIGYFTEEKGTQGFPMPLMRVFYPSVGNFVAVVDQVFSNHAQQLKKTMSNVISLPVYSINAPTTIPGVDFSDHRNYWKYGYPAIMVTDTAFYRNTAYHSPNDKADRLDYGKMSQVVEGIYSYVKQIASNQ